MDTVYPVSPRNLHPGGVTAHNLLGQLPVPTRGPQTILPSASQDSETEGALGVTEGIGSDQGSPGMGAASRCDHDLHVSRHPFPARSPQTFITQLQKKAARPR